MAKDKAYSYVRFSTPEQAAGDSLRRQTEGARQYAAANGLELDETLTIQDLGISAFRGANAATGRLGEFLDAVRRGMVPKGSYLLVENLDRISRQTAWDAASRLREILAEGINVVTLSDKKVYTKDTMDDPMSLIMSILVFVRGHEESVTKQKRNRAAWEAKRASAKEKPLTASCPGWLRLDREAREFEVITERAAVVRRIFRMAIKGIGHHSIAASLNEEKVPTFTTNGKTQKLWHRSYIAKILSNPAVIGTFIPHTEHHEGGKLIRRPQAPMEDYYPAVVKVDEYQRVQAMRQVKASPQRGRHAGQVSNVLGGLVRCPKCASTMTVVNKGESYRYFVCTKAKARAGCKYTTVPYADIETALLLAPEAITENVPDMDEAEAALRHDLKAAELDAEHAAEELAGLLHTAAQARGRRPVALVEQIERAEAWKLEAEAKVRAMRERLLAYSRPALDVKLAELEEAFRNMDRMAANVLMRQLFSRVVLDYPKKRLVFAWQHGGESAVEYAWVSEYDSKKAA